MSFETADISLALPCYNEEASLGDTIPELAKAFAQEHISLELVLVDNGSTDSTGKVIDDMVAKGLPITKVTVKVNQGYGHGILEGLRNCHAPLIGYLCADGQVGATDVVRIYRLMAGREYRTLAKVRRRFRQDSWKRKVVSTVYNLMMFMLFGSLGAIDINGSPKIFSKKNFDAMKLSSTDWFLDPEIIIKAKYLGLRVIETDVEGYARQGGVSNVKMGTCMEFLKNIVAYRIGWPLRTWRNEVQSHHQTANAQPTTQAKDDQWVGGADRRQKIDDPSKVDLLKCIRIVDQARHEDDRGYLHKVLAGSHCRGGLPSGEVYVSAARQGQAKGNHWHRKMGEWFTIIEGQGTIEVCDPRTKARRSIPVLAAKPQSVYVPAGLAHAVVNQSQETLICIACAEAEHDPDDVMAFTVWPIQTATETDEPKQKPVNSHIEGEAKDG